MIDIFLLCIKSRKALYYSSTVTSQPEITLHFHVKRQCMNAVKIGHDLLQYTVMRLATSQPREFLFLASGPGEALGYFLGGYVPPGTPNWHPVLKKISPKIDTPF